MQKRPALFTAINLSPNPRVALAEDNVGCEARETQEAEKNEKKESKPAAG